MDEQVTINWVRTLTLWAPVAGGRAGGQGRFGLGYGLFAGLAGLMRRAGAGVRGQ